MPAGLTSVSLRIELGFRAANGQQGGQGGIVTTLSKQILVAANCLPVNISCGTSSMYTGSQRDYRSDLCTWYCIGASKAHRGGAGIAGTRSLQSSEVEKANGGGVKHGQHACG